MKKSISKSVYIRLLSFAITAIVLLVGAAITGYSLVNNYKNTIEYNYHKALNELSDYVTDIKNTLIKGMYANTPTGQTQVYSSLMVYSEGAKAALATLPISVNEEEDLQKYFSQIGDFSCYLQKLVAGGKKISENDINSFKGLQKYSENIAVKIEALSAEYGNGSISLGKEIDMNSNLTLDKKEADGLVLDSGFREIDDSFVDYPTLIYDGPFSDHIMQRKAFLTEGAEEKSLEDAFMTASLFLNVPPEKINHEYDIDGNLPCYVLSYDSYYLSITKKGGYVNFMTNSREISEDKLSYDEAYEKAENFLKANKINNMAVTYGLTENGICTFNFAYTKDAVTYYSDLIKISVALDNGEIVSYSATGFIMNHRSRQISDNTVSLGEALKSVKDSLKIESEKMVMIPTSGSNEVFCYEFLCSDQNNKLLIYINAETGLEENIYILIEDENGAFTI